ncbi:MAG TPA: hypothetical protein VLB49_13045 [Gemmatimonadales bacterium]|nr:hypothetical protein [Gemmatimonadales bacterium]
MMTFALVLAVALQAPDSARAVRWERALNETTDSLDHVRGAAAAFRVDLRNASHDLVVVRAAQVRATCGAADAPLQALERLLTGEVYDPRARSAQERLRSGTTELRRTLTRCQREWQTGSRPTISGADSLRAWGPYRTAQLDAALRRYLGLVRSFMKQANLRKPAVS